jgi:hypothetical protein
MKYNIVIERKFMGLSREYVAHDIEAASEQDALEIWRLQQPKYWSPSNGTLDMINRTFDGSQITIELVI